MRIPAAITKGDSIAWEDDPTTDNLGQPVDSSQYTLKYELRGSSQLTLTAASNGSGWRTTLATSASDSLVAGIYYWQAVATKTGARVTLGSGQVTIKENLGGISQAYDGRSQAQKDLDAVQAAMRSMIAGGAVAEYSIGGRSLRKHSLTDLMALESKLKYDVAKERRAQEMANGLGNNGKTLVRFR